MMNAKSIQVLLDTFILSNFSLLAYIYCVLPWLARVVWVLRWLAGWCSGRSWFHRICADKRAWGPTRKGRSIQLLALNLRHSRSLQAEAKLILIAPPPLALQMDLDRISKIIALKKRIPLDSEAYGILKEALSHIIQLERLVDQVVKRARTHFVVKDHLILLQSLWTNLHPSSSSNSQASPPSIPDKKWKEIGFQGTDPSTDFRGMGLLGLDQLLEFSQVDPKSAHNILQQSNLGAAWFTFATVGINITALLYSLLVSRSADEYFYSLPAADLDAFNAVYRWIFERFALDWVVEEAVDVMDFSRIFGKLRNELEFNLQNYGQFFRK